MYRAGVWVRCVIILIFLHIDGAGTDVSCPISELFNPNVFEKVCQHTGVNVTVLRCLHDIGNDVYVNYSVQRSGQDFVPIAIEVYIEGERAAAFECMSNGSIPDSNGMNIVQVFFTDQCKDLIVVINSLLTVNLTLELKVTLTDDEEQCNIDLIGPQRLNVSTKLDTESGQEIPVLRLLNVRICNRNGRPAVPIRLSTSTNASITMHPDGNNEARGDISVQPLPCDDNHTQEYKVSVSSTEDYTLSAKILHATLPKECIVVRVSNNTPTATSGSDAAQTPYIPIVASVVPTVTVTFVITVGVIAVVLACHYKLKQKGHGVYDIRKSELCEPKPEVVSTPPASGGYATPVSRPTEIQYATHRVSGSSTAELSSSGFSNRTGPQHTQAAEDEMTDV